MFRGGGGALLQVNAPSSPMRTRMLCIGGREGCLGWGAGGGGGEKGSCQTGAADPMQWEEEEEGGGIVGALYISR